MGQRLPRETTLRSEQLISRQKRSRKRNRKDSRKELRKRVSWTNAVAE